MARRNWWKVYLVLITPLCVAYHLHLGAAHSGPVMNVVGASAVVAILVGARINRPASRMPWRLIALAQAVFVAGDVVAYNYSRLFHTELPYPSAADVLYLSVYPLIVSGLLVLIRKRTPGGDRAGLIDSLIVSLGLGMLSWKFLMAPYAHDQSLTLLRKLISMGYPIMDVLVLTVLARLAFGGGRRGRAYGFLISSAIALLGTDTIFGYLLLHGGYTTGGYLDVGWMTFYVLLGAAALHPTMRNLSEPIPDRDARPSRTRLGLLALAAIAAPMTAAVLILRGDTRELVVFAAGSVVMFLLVLWRMAGLVRNTEIAARRERVLRETADGFVGATDPDGILAAARAALRAIAPAGASVLVATGPRPDTVTLSIHDEGAEVLRDLPAAAVTELRQHRTVSLPLSRDAASNGRWLFALPLMARRTLAGMFVVVSHGKLPSATENALVLLGSQTGMAIESAALTEDLVRQRSESRFRALVQNSSDVLAVVDIDTTVRYVSPSVERILGYRPDDLAGRPFADLVHEDDRSLLLAVMEHHTGASQLIECRMRRHDGSWAFVETLRTSLMHDPDIRGIVLNARDVSERKAFEEALERQAFSDSVTGLANRALLQDRIEHALRRHERDEQKLAVLFIDLDDFKTVNDGLGHAAGDVLLERVAGRIRTCMRSGDTAARLGGDEFAVLVEAPASEGEVIEIARRILRVVKEPFTIEGSDVFTSASIGIAFAEGHAGQDRVDDLLRNADAAMYAAKKTGKGTFELFRPAMHQAVVHRLELKADLQRALDNDELEVWYQPVVDLAPLKVHGFEALLRWNSPKRGQVPPHDFVPLAEETGLIVPIGAWVLREACRTVKELGMTWGDDVSVAVNISARQLQRSEVVREVEASLYEAGLDPSRLVLEITESVMMQDMDLAIQRLGELKALGVQLAVDDFGTGYSSLNYIRQFPVDILKIDKSFIDDLTTDPEVRALTRTIVDLARVLGLRPLAEGVEDAEHAEALLALGCTSAQGYYFAPPAPRDRIAVPRIPVAKQALAAV